jgi:pimeloyl-ACP methyl ester carboxylesterase
MQPQDRPWYTSHMQTSDGSVTMEDGVRLYFQKVGSSTTAVMVPNGFHLLDDFRHLGDWRTLIFYDVRNRGRSDPVTDRSKLARGILQDVDDLDAVRRHFGLDQLHIIGHSYIGWMVALYAMKYPAHAGRVVQIGPMQPDAAKQYPAHLTNADATFAELMAKIGQMMKEPPSGDPEEVCRKFWSALRVMYGANPKDAYRIDWGRCELPNERNFMRYWTEHILPSIQGLELTAEEMAKAKAPVLILHGTKDRSAPYGGGLDWAMQLPDARLVTVENAAHAPWIEARELVFGSIQTFLDGAWPEAAEKVTSSEPGDEAVR